MTLHPAEPPVTIDRVLMRNEWRELAFLHWSYEPEAIQAALPDGLEVESWEGRAWVGLVPFQMHIKTRRLPYLPWLSHFPETNLRTYVRGPNGEVGIWFFSLDAARLAAVIAGRLGYGVRYHWAEMKIEHFGPESTYESHRLMASHSGLVRIRIRQGEPIPPDAVTPFEHYLTARWTLFGQKRNRLTFARASHETWPLRQVEVISWDVDLFEPAGLPNPSGEPIGHTSPGVDARIGPVEYLS